MASVSAFSLTDIFKRNQTTQEDTNADERTVTRDRIVDDTEAPIEQKRQEYLDNSVIQTLRQNKIINSPLETINFINEEGEDNSNDEGDLSKEKESFNYLGGFSILNDITSIKVENSILDTWGKVYNLEIRFDIESPNPKLIGVTSVSPLIQTFQHMRTLQVVKIYFFTLEERDSFLTHIKKSILEYNEDE